jgi:hypothetical protein
MYNDSINVIGIVGGPADGQSIAAENPLARVIEVRANQSVPLAGVISLQVDPNGAFFYRLKEVAGGRRVYEYAPALRSDFLHAVMAQYHDRKFRGQGVLRVEYLNAEATDDGFHFVRFTLSDGSQLDCRAGLLPGDDSGMIGVFPL